MSEHRRPGEAPKHAIVDGSVLTNAEKAKSLVAGAPLAALGTVAAGGSPFVSHVVPAFEASGDILFLFSGLAEHTKALLDDPRASALFVDTVEEGGEASALARVTLSGRCTPVTDEERAACTEFYVAQHPGSAAVATFTDFRPFRLVPDFEQGIRWIGGFGRAAWVDLASYRAAAIDPIARHRREALAAAGHHRAEILGALRTKLLAVDGVAPSVESLAHVQLLAVDSRGVDVLLRSPVPAPGALPPRALRLAFTSPAPDFAALRHALEALQ